jgi:aminopeptidase N
MDNSKVIYLKDYKQTSYNIEEVFLHFDIYPDRTIVKSLLKLQKRADGSDKKLVLNGESLTLLELILDGIALSSREYSVDDKFLTIFNPPEKFTLEISVEIHPEKNTKLMGLYQSGTNFYTQCEPEGFRRITYFYDRPDMMTRFTTAISADAKQYPTLLSNGNLVDTQQLADGRHWVKWVDPSLKPCYLFALVAGDFDVLEDTFITMSNRKVDLKIFLDKGTCNQGFHALDSLKKAMAWDEANYNREYDLDIYMVVAVSDFNFGAMENKGLNLFNSKCVLASPEVATDSDYVMVENVIAHEYFHNWSGNRVTCRDWFQITLKEGLTVFRDQGFTEDVTDPSVARINEVNILREHQFAEDSGPLSHPIRPEEYIEINNFYTTTVYNKGAEIIRMIKTIIGADDFHKAMDEYFHRFDGQAVTTEDFVSVMEEVSGVDLTQFKRWYMQNGTPIISVSGSYDKDKEQYSLLIKQRCPLQGQQDKKEFVIPVRYSLYTSGGEKLSITTADRSDDVLLLTEQEHVFVFNNITEEVVPSVLQHFSAPVKCEIEYTPEDLKILLEYDQDGFNRFDAMQKYLRNILITAIKANCDIKLSRDFINVYKYCLRDSSVSPYYLSRLLILPGEQQVLEHVIGSDILQICRLISQLGRQLSIACFDEIKDIYTSLYSTKNYEFNVSQMGRRALANLCLNMLLQADHDNMYDLAVKQYNAADNLTDRIGALQALNKIESAARDEALKDFYHAWQDEPLVMDKWFALHASAPLPHTFAVVQKLMEHDKFDVRNPNKVRALLGSFAVNLPVFHAVGGDAYKFLVEQVARLDKQNPQLATRIIQPMVQWKRYDANRQELMCAALKTLANNKSKLSSDLYEVVHKSL